MSELKPDEISQITKEYSFGTWRTQKSWKPLVITHAKGCYFYDINGKEYLDFSSGLIAVNLGHSNENVVNSIIEQAKKLQYIAPAFATPERAELNKLLIEVMPKGITKFFYSTSGTEANEAAIKIARLYTKNYKIISRYTSYHGSTAGSIALTGDPRRWPVEPTGKINGVIFAPDAYCYRCPFNLEYPNCGIACADYVDYMIRNEGNVAAMIVEPVVGTNGVIVPPKEYLPKIREITKKHGVLLIDDEVMVGWGRVGEWFAINHWNVLPDMVSTAKGVTSAYIPLGVTGTTREIADYFEENYFAHGHTYEAHPMTLAPAIAAIKEYKRLNLIEEAKRKGEYLGRRLNELKEKHRSIGDVRGLGMFWAIELVKDRKTKEPFNTRIDQISGKPLVVGKISIEAMKRGVFVNGWISHLLIAPPLIATIEEIDKGVNVLDEVIKIADEEAKKST